VDQTEERTGDIHHTADFGIADRDKSRGLTEEDRTLLAVVRAAVQTAERNLGKEDRVVVHSC
jgi:hypothetical protein